MKNNLFFSLSVISHLLFSQVGINTDSPHPLAALDIHSDKTGANRKGILIPRIQLISTKDRTNRPVRGLLVYNTKTQDDVLANNFYYYDGTKWVPILSKNETTNVPIAVAVLELKDHIYFEEANLKTPIKFDRIVHLSNNLIRYDSSNGIFTVQQDGMYSINLQVGIRGTVDKRDNIIGIIAAENIGTYQKGDWLGAASWTPSINYTRSEYRRTFATYATYIEFKKGEKFQAAALATVMSRGVKTGIQGIQKGTSGKANVTHIRIIKY